MDGSRPSFGDGTVSTQSAHAQPFPVLTERLNMEHYRPLATSAKMYLNILRPFVGIAASQGILMLRGGARRHVYA